MGMTRTLAASIMKEFYGSLIQQTLNNEIKLMQFVERSSKKAVDGNRYNYPVHSTRNAGVGAAREGQALPAAGYQGIDSVYVTMAYNYCRIDLTGQVIKSTAKTTFVQALSLEMEGARKDMRFDMGRQTYENGNGILCQTGQTSCTTTIYVKNRYWAPGHPGSKYIQRLGQYTIGDIGTADELSTTSTRVGQIITLTPAAGSGANCQCDLIESCSSWDTVTACGHFMFRASIGSGVAGTELKGLRAIIDDNTATNCYGLTGGYFDNAVIYNVDRDLIKGWNSYVDANTATERILDSFRLQRAESEVAKATGKNVSRYFGEYKVVDAFWDSVAGDRRFNSPKFDAGVDSLTFGGKTFTKDLLAPENELFGFNDEVLRWYETCPFEFADDDGRVLKNVSGYDRWEAFIRHYGQMAPGEFCAPNGAFVIRDIKVDL